MPQRVRLAPYREEIDMTTGNFGTPWPKADVLFLIDACDRGMSFANIAGFLGRTEDEVRTKSKRMPRKRALAANAGDVSPRRVAHG
jgi:hypothetical protein